MMFYDFELRKYVLSCALVSDSLTSMTNDFNNIYNSVESKDTKYKFTYLKKSLLKG